MAVKPCLDDMLAHYLALFPFRFETCVKRPGTINWRQVSRFHYLSDQEIADSLQTVSNLQRSVSFDKESRFLVVSIPASSQYHSPESLARIRSAFMDVGIRIAAYQFENDWYLYIYFREKIPTEKFASILQRWFERSGYEIGPEAIQIFPCATPLPLPLQPGFAWLTDNGQPFLTRNELDLYAALELFHSDISKYQIASEVFEQIDVDTVLPLPNQITHIADDAVQSLDEVQPESAAPEPIQSIDPEPAELASDRLDVSENDQLDSHTKEHGEVTGHAPEEPRAQLLLFPDLKPALPPSTLPVGPKQYLLAASIS